MHEWKSEDKGRLYPWRGSAEAIWWVLEGESLWCLPRELRQPMKFALKGNARHGKGGRQDSLMVFACGWFRPLFCLLFQNSISFLPFIFSIPFHFFLSLVLLHHIVCHSWIALPFLFVLCVAALPPLIPPTDTAFHSLGPHAAVSPRQSSTRWAQIQREKRKRKERRIQEERKGKDGGRYWRRAPRSTQISFCFFSEMNVWFWHD